MTEVSSIYSDSYIDWFDKQQIKPKENIVPFYYDSIYGKDLQSLQPTSTNPISNDSNIFAASQQSPVPPAPSSIGTFLNGKAKQEVNTDSSQVPTASTVPVNKDNTAQVASATEGSNGNAAASPANLEAKPVSSEDAGKKQFVIAGKQYTEAEYNKLIKGKKFDEALTQFYGPKYKTASDEEKEKLADKFFSDYLSGKDKDAQYRQLDLYRLRSSDPKEYERLTKMISNIDSSDKQVLAADSFINKGTSAQKNIGQNVIADDYQNYQEEAQGQVAQKLADTNNAVVIQKAASHASELADSQQYKAVNAFEGSKISVADKYKVDKTIINQYQDFAVQNQSQIHALMAKSSIEKTQVYAAQHIDCLDESVQYSAVKSTIDSGNYAAIKAAYTDNSFDSSVAQKIVPELATAVSAAATQGSEASGSDSPLNLLSLTPSDSLSQTSDTNEASEALIEAAQNPDVVANALTSQQSSVEDIIALANNSNDFDKLKDAVDDLSDAAKMNLLLYSSNPNILKAILGENPTTQILFNLDMSMINKIGLDQILPQLGFLNPITQLAVVKLCAQNGKLSEIKKDELSPTIQTEYDKISSELKKKNKV